MGDPWVQSIGGSLIAALIVSLAVFALRHRREALFSINVSTVIFAFGNILEPAAKYVLEGPEAVKDVFLANERLDKAADLLRYTQMRVKEITYSVGYCQEPSFNRAFRKRFDCSPVSFRKEQHLFLKGNRFG